MTWNYHHALGGTATDGGLEQNEQELLMLTDFIKRKRIASFLEIGLAAGHLQRYMMELGLQCFGVTPNKRDTHEGLVVVYGFSQHEHVIKSVQKLIARITPFKNKPDALFDLIFVDGDHTYEAVRADYRNYKDMCRYMAFHDILGLRNCQGVAKLWSELKSKHKYLEFIADNKEHASGIGVIILGED